MQMDHGLEEIGVETKDMFWDDSICDILINDKRQSKWKEQREAYGFDEREIWSLDTRIAIFLYPRILFYKEHVSSDFIEPCATASQWNKILDIILFSFGEYANYFKNEPRYKTGESEEELNRRIKRYFRRLKDGRIAFAIWYSHFSV